MSESYFSPVTDTRRKGDLFSFTTYHGLLGRTFYGQVKNVVDFIELMEDAFLYAVIQGGEVVGYTWLNMFSGRAAATHVCLFPTARDKVALGKQFVEGILTEGHFKTLIGIVPDTYQHAVNYALALGYEFQGHIPYAMDVNGEVTGASVYTLVKED